MEVVLVLAVVAVLVIVQIRRRGSRLQRAEDPRAGADGRATNPPDLGEAEPGDQR